MKYAFSKSVSQNTFIRRVRVLFAPKLRVFNMYEIQIGVFECFVRNSHSARNIEISCNLIDSNQGVSLSVQEATGGLRATPFDVNSILLARMPKTNHPYLARLHQD